MKSKLAPHKNRGAKSPFRDMDDLHSLLNESGRTDAANADRFVSQCNGKLLFVPEWKRWLAWDGNRWRDDCGVAVWQKAKRYGKSLWSEFRKLVAELDRNQLGPLQSFIKATNQRPRMEAFVALAQSDVRVACPMAKLNQNPSLLNVENGTIDLETGERRAPDPKYRITQIANVTHHQGATCPEWEATMNLVFGGNPELVRYVQKICGFSISGTASEHILPVAYGEGCNGKSTLTNVIMEILGDYALLSNDSLLTGYRDNHPTEKAALYQKRFVAISEPERNCKLRESRVKELTGERSITARRMREDFWTFQRTHTFWMSTNHLPQVDGRDEGIWRRIKLIPFEVDLRQVTTPRPDFDRYLIEKESSGILNWLIKGYQMYLEEGLSEPEAVLRATSRYRNDSDPMGEFLDSCCIVEPGAVATAKELFEAYQRAGGPDNQTNFGRALSERFDKDKPTAGPYRRKTIYIGLRLRSEWDDVNPKEQGESRDFIDSTPVGTS